MKPRGDPLKRWNGLRIALAAEGPLTACLLCTSGEGGLATWRSNP